MKPMKVLALCDSPTLVSGFSRVAANLFKRWAKAGAVIDVWGIAFLGWDYKKHPYLNQIFPAGVGGEWCQPARLEIFLAQLQHGGYTHVWLMQDTFALSPHGFPSALRKICTAQKIRSMLYFPVDAPLEPEWTDIIACVDVPVAYTDYGRAEAHRKHALRYAALKAAAAQLDPPGPDLPYQELPIAVLPHGVDTSVYHPLADRDKVRASFWAPMADGRPFAGPEDFLMVNLNANQRRKDTGRSLEILARLLQLGVPAKLVMHMPASNDQGTQLHLIGEQLGLRLNVDWTHHDQYFARGQGLLPETPRPGAPASLLELYNVADLYLTTSLGEGWGLGITEALACGTPIAIPNHTSCCEIAGRMADFGMVAWRVVLPLEDGLVCHDLDNSRLRPRVAVQASADAIARWYQTGDHQRRFTLTPSARAWLDWDRIASEMLLLLKG